MFFFQNRSFGAKGNCSGSAFVDLTSDDVTIATVVKQEAKAVVKEEDEEKSHIKQVRKCKMSKKL